MFVIVGLALANGLESAVVASPAVFRLRSSDGLETLVSGSSVLLEDACPSAALLGANHSLSCSVAFEVERDPEPEALVYSGATDAGEPIREEAPVTAFRRCSRCQGDCVDVTISSEHCGECDSPVPEGGQCVDGVPTCPAGECGDRCVDLETDPDNCGSCDNACPENSRCRDGECACTGSRTSCDDGCVDASSDPRNCGECGHECETEGTGAGCFAGVCHASRAVLSRRRCDDVCAASDMTCLSAEAIYEDEVDDGTFKDCLGNQYVMDLDCSATPPDEYVGNPEYSCVYAFDFVGCVCSE